MNWQPIETAPKDGTEVLCWREDCGPFIAKYTSVDSFPLTQAEIDAMDEEALFHKDWFTQWPQAFRLDGSEAPTHWMPLPAAPGEEANVSPMAKVAAALRQKAEQEEAVYQTRRSDQGLAQSEWGPMEENPIYEDPPKHVAVVEGDDAVRTLQWNRDVGAFDFPVGTKLYAAPSAQPTKESP